MGDRPEFPLAGYSGARAAAPPPRDSGRTPAQPQNLVPHSSHEVPRAHLAPSHAHPPFAGQSVRVKAHPRYLSPTKSCMDVYPVHGHVLEYGEGELLEAVHWTFTSSYRMEEGHRAGNDASDLR
ncbi:hypothetical protein MYCTH_2127818 [Thermothelomyces thermophilus ATCC 42464]|uniref:Uncharacterized protein n=1 Tax=Thermothelomyces thermophilus (strain ATCC 42464 / BCRC 31852 / DSM 1799) TaxID=573729 RepID=G2QHA6_THET4|nr:uncharacterized protein MYCTH_2127818 [Thermothelomyces thermophilus ATCC 42464]AEO58766.1 hypothetical protein MYCTH_2127818 [Thermothelomyces thermophilus ATCC 42464]